MMPMSQPFSATSFSSLDALLESRRWQRRTDPYLHVVANEVFVPDVREALEAEFFRLLKPAPQSRGSAGTTPFTRNMSGYDASGIAFTPELTGPFRLFISRAWHDLLASLFGVEATGDVNAALHHHVVGSANGRIHNDLNPGWFAGAASDSSVNVSDHRLCNYHGGPTGEHPSGQSVRETVRAVAMIYYLANPPWAPGDGGETALYRHQGGPIGEPDVIVPPLNNSLLAFECTPYSHHTFLSNRRSMRNSVILWLHRTKADAVRRWGDRAIVPWPKGY
jgi:hypothetical protein